ncbi:MAG TPA: LpqB family beta-propeller domain-containing protein [Longimicrobium sp.]|nr:LpqB family beta-propeller domain-containing protein [Longimicrobium sp.]
MKPIHALLACAALLSACSRGGAAPGGEVLFVSERDGQAEVYAVRPAGGPPRRLTRAASADYPAAVAPDGAAVLVVSVAGEGAAQSERMSVLPLDGGAARPLGLVSARVRSPAWAPDGSWLAFESDTASFRDLYRIGRDGSGLRRLTHAPQGSFEPEVSPDGGSIAFVSSRDGDAEVYVMRADGAAQRRITAFHRDDWGPRWSPDGRTLVFLSNREGRDRLFLVQPDGSGLRPLAPALHDSVADAAEPAWSPDGRRIAFTLRARGGASRIAAADLRGNVSFLTPAGERASTPAWSPDGAFIAYTRQAEGDAEVWLVRADGRGARPLVRSPGADWLPRWVPAR